MRIRPTLTLLLGLVVSLLSSCVRERDALSDDVLTISVEQHSAWIRNFNPFSPNARRFTRAGIYEPLMIFNSVSGELVPWLASDFHWSADYKTLTFSIREGVQFSDGAPLTAEDVVFSFQLLKRFPALDTGGLWTVLESVQVSKMAETQSSKSEVMLSLIEPFQPKLYDLAQHIVIPQHIWSEVDDPITFTNPDPIGTGPFTEVSVFRSQLFELSRNPYYWREGRPAIRALRFPAFPSNDQANLALVTGDVDWAGNFVPAIERTFIAPAPKRRHYWFPLVGSVVNLIPNTAKPPFDQLEVRRALSYAIDRERLVEIAMYGYTRPADSTGLSDGFAQERDPKIPSEFPWTEYRPQRSIELLKSAGFERKSDGWHSPGADEPISLTIDVVSGWSDWVRAAQVISQQLAELGIKAKVRTSEFSSWFERLRNGHFELAIAWADDRGSLYEYYRWLMSDETVKPIGEGTAGNFHRFGDKQADQLLTMLKKGVSESENLEISRSLQGRYAELTPVIPLFPNPQWGAASTERIVGFPSAEDPYAPLSPNREPECLLVFDRLTPRSKGESR